MDEELIKKIPPHSTEAEQSVIGSMIIDTEAVIIASELITSEDFYHKAYGALFETISELYDKGSPIDFVTLQNRLREKDVPPEIRQFGICARRRGECPYIS